MYMYIQSQMISIYEVPEFKKIKLDFKHNRLICTQINCYPHCTVQMEICPHEMTVFFLVLTRHSQLLLLFTFLLFFS